MRNASRAMLVVLALLGPRVAFAADVAEGKLLAETLCSRCHAVGLTDSSALPVAPPFRTLKTRYPVESLAEALAEGMVTGHQDMPEVQLEPVAIRNFIAYLKTL